MQLYVENYLIQKSYKYKNRDNILNPILLKLRILFHAYQIEYD